MKGISLFASSWIGDLAMKSAGIEILLSNELLEDRWLLHKRNFPKTKMIIWDIWEKEEEIINTTNSLLNWEELDFVFATPPCQWMSKNWKGKLLQWIREWNKSKFDKRNQLIIPTINIIKQLKPKTVVFENVPEMRNTIIEDKSWKSINIINYIEKELWSEYLWTRHIVQFADYWIPQRRSRLITIYSRDQNMKNHFIKENSFIPETTHNKNWEWNKQKRISVKQIIWETEPLDSKSKETSIWKTHPLHYVPVLDEKKYYWISNTPIWCWAFDNQCIECWYKENPTHWSKKNNWINQSKKDTPLYCIKCWSLLPRPYTIQKDWSKKLMSWFTSAYKRMSWDLPSPTLTTNLSYPSSDHKIHPSQNRVLSLYEAIKLHTIDLYEYEWEFTNWIRVKDKTIKESIWESIPPKGLEILLKYIVKIIKN